MNKINKVHCFFEQSGTFKNEFIKLGIPAEDYDIQNNFDETDHVVDLFAEIEKGYNNEPSIFDNINEDDLIFAFFPCIYFCDMSTLNLKFSAIFHNVKDVKKSYEFIIRNHHNRDIFFCLLSKLICIVRCRNFKFILENPYNGQTYLKDVFPAPTILDKNRMLRGDFFVKPTAYWFINIERTYGLTLQNNKEQKLIWSKNKQIRSNTNKKFAKGAKKTGICSEERSMISPDYARNFICDFVIGKTQQDISTTLF